MLTKNEMDKQASKALSPLTAKEKKEMISESVAFLDKNPSNHLMLFSKELSYMTIFKKKNLVQTHYGLLEEVVKFIDKDKFLTLNVGSLKLIEESDDFIEMWIGEYHFALFPCDSFIVEI